MDAMRLTVVYDETCAFCLRCRDWLALLPVLVPVELMAAGSREARERFGGLPWLGQELVVVNERDEAWVGPAAFLICLWATARYRSWSYVLSHQGLVHLAERFFIHVSRRRDRYARWLRRDDDCTYCEDVRIRRAP